jgi:hypothetical protein
MNGWFVPMEGLLPRAVARERDKCDGQLPIQSKNRQTTAAAGCRFLASRQAAGAAAAFLCLAATFLRLR